MDFDNLYLHELENQPSPDNFGQFLPWACRKLDILDNIIITNVQTTFVSSRATGQKQKHGKDKAIQHPSKTADMSAENNLSSVPFKVLDEDVNKVNIITVYDTNGNLLQLKFERNKEIPRKIFKILGKILTYHAHLTSISINKGIDVAIIHELHILTKLSITDICLDGTCVRGANYDVLLESQNHLKNLSIARCNIDDEVVKRIAERLTYPYPASQSLALINLTSNRITDEGAKYLGEALRSNRCLAYLNLSDNDITDVGSFAILEVLDKFQVMPDEMKTSRCKYIQFWKENHPENEKGEEEKKPTSRRKLTRLQAEPRGGKRSKMEKQETETSSKNAIIHEDDGFIDPFSRTNTLLINGQIYCYGNTQLAYLNISYNNISYVTIKKLLAILQNQRSLNRKPKGLVHLALEGNKIPATCEEYNEIYQILQPSAHKMSTKLKRKPSKNVI